MLEEIGNALRNIVGFFKSIYDFIIDIPKAIYDFFTTGFKLIFEGLKNLTILLFNVITELWNWIADVMKNIFINPIVSFIHDITDRINRKLDGIIFILIGVPLMYKQFEDFIKEPSKKKIGWLILTPIATYILSKTIANWIKKRRYTAIAIPSFKLEKPEELKKNIAVIEGKDALLGDYVMITKGLPYIALSDLLIGDLFGSSTIRRGQVSVNITDWFASDTFSYEKIRGYEKYLTNIDELLSDRVNVVAKSQSYLIVSDGLLIDNFSYAKYTVNVSVCVSYIDNVTPFLWAIADVSYIDNPGAYSQ